MTTMAHKRLAFRFNMMHVPAPRTEGFFEMLDLLFSEEEAHLAASFKGLVGGMALARLGLGRRTARRLLSR